MALQMQSSCTALTTSSAISIFSPADLRLGLRPRTVAVLPGKLPAWRRVWCNGGGDVGKKKAVPNANYVVPLDKFSSSSSITRPLVEILRDLNKKIPDNIVKSNDPRSNTGSSGFIPWYHANRMLSFYAPGWCGEVRDVIFAENGNVTVVYRLTIRGSDGEAHRESTGTVSASDEDIEDPVAAAEEIAFCRACARFGLGLYLYHDK
ncbi:PREDICTED: uncharacterized protein LOC104801415 [Tarenaya hassleriana]|uniref:uncharacterized protein LOC104801415 n=1 Tax=Tarenaya hassleriana TaxID=28532 RepID=UPI00053CA8EE|nr:PREDICTED: uncharacterized protein LOC104801415 [Tarenaya hassleriana]